LDRYSIVAMAMSGTTIKGIENLLIVMISRWRTPVR